MLSFRLKASLFLERFQFVELGAALVVGGRVPSQGFLILSPCMKTRVSSNLVE